MGGKRPDDTGALRMPHFAKAVDGRAELDRWFCAGGACEIIPTSFGPAQGFRRLSFQYVSKCLRRVKTQPSNGKVEATLVSALGSSALSLKGLHFFRPCRFDEGQYGLNLGIAQDIAERGHA